MVTTYGHWFPEIYMPDSVYVSYEKAKEVIIGKIFRFYGWTTVDKTITTDDIVTENEPEKTIIPFQSEADCIEMRVCWLIKSTTYWNFHVDVITGRLIYVEQRIIA